MDKWDEDKLRLVVSAKGNPRTTTDIVCKYFVEAIETQKYGWFWECPNGEIAVFHCVDRSLKPDALQARNACTDTHYRLVSF
jgi:hypothetical protein